MKKIKLILLALTILSAKFYAQVPSYVPTTGLVGWWPFNGNANDASVNSINGINYGATLTTDRNGNSNSAYLFSGAQWIQCGYNPILNVGSGSFTLSCWATKTGGNTFQHFITRNEITAWPNATTSYALRYQGPGVGIYASGNATNSNGSIATSSLSNLSNWNHFIGVYNATTGIISVYVNGVLSITSPIAANPQSYNNNGGLFFGVEHPTVTLPSGPQFLSGKLDDIGIWNRALTQNEITALYTNTPPPTIAISATNSTICEGSTTTLTATSNGAGPCATAQLASNLQTGLVGYWPFCGNANDASGNGNNGTVNGATLTADRFGNAGSAYSFDGIDDYISGTTTNLSVQSTDKLTMTAWVKVNQFAPSPAAAKLITHTDNSNNGQQYALSIGNDGSLYFLAGNGDFENNGPNSTLPSQITINTWKHVGAVISDDSVKLFVNGVMVFGKAEIDVFPGNPVGNFIFSSLTNSTFNKLFNGTLDDIGIWNRALTATEIQQLYTLGNTTYSWSPGGATTPSITVSPTSSTTYTCTATANGVSSSTTSVVNVIPSPTITTTNSTICAGQSTTLTASTVSTGTSCPTMTGSLTSGLVGFWPFCGNANDASVNGNNGTVNGATLTTDRFGNSNSAYSFNGSGNQNISISGLTMESEFTLSLWYQTNSYSSPVNPTLCYFGLEGFGTNYTRTVDLTIDNFNYPQPFLRANLNYNFGFAGTYNSPVNWTNITVKLSSSILYFYMDNVLIQSTPVTKQALKLLASDVSRIGSANMANGTASGYFTGKLDDVAIWNRALTASEIQTLHNLGQTTYSWSNGATTPSITVSPTTTTTYTCTVTDANGNTCSEAVTITVNQLPVATITANGPTSLCTGQSVTLCGPSGPGYTYMWCNGAITDCISTSFPGNYCLIVTDANGCVSANNQILITTNPVAIANAGIDSTITCFNNNVGVQIGIPPQIGYTYSWSPAIGLSNPNIANPIANPGQTTIYMLTATNSSGCSATDQVTVTVDVFTPFLNLSPNVTICQGSSATLTASTNLSGLTWWEGPQFLGNQNTITVTPNIVGQHTYNVTASSNCPGSGLFLASVTVTVNPTPIAFAGSDSTITCNQHINGYQIGWFPTAGNTYSWSPTIGLSNPNIANPIANPPVTTTYTLTVTNSSGCVATDQVTATVNTSTSVISVSPNITICQGSSATLIGNANPGGLYWVGSNQYWSQDTIVVTPNTPGSQIYTAFSTNGCSNNSVVVTVLPSPQINSVNDQFTCAGTPTMPINFSGTPGATYSWANSNTSIGLAPIGNGNIPTFIAQNNSPYTIMATIIVTPSLTTGNQTCIGTPEIFNILVEPVPIAYPVNNEVVCCQSSTSPIIFYSNVPANFSWFAVSSSPQLTGYPINGTGIIPSFTPVNNSSIAETITFSYTAIGAQGCYGPTSTFTITVLPCNISVDPVTNLEFCNPGNFNGITFTGNASSYNWTNNQPGSGIPIFGTGSIPSSTLTNNTQQVIVSHIVVTPTFTTNGLSCAGNGIDFFINVYPTPAVNAGTDQNICIGDLVTLTGSGAHTYVWNNGVDNGVPFAPSNSTSYVVTGTDVNGCVNSDTIQINVNTPSSSTVNINSCDSYTLNGQTYNSGGIYTQVIPNAAGCDSTITLDLTLNYSPITPIVTIQNEVNLSTSNNSGVTYQWIQCSDLTAIAGQINSSFNPTVNGLYAVVATNSCGSDTSDCADVSTIGFFDMKQYQILVYPNPNNGEFYIEIPSELLGQLLRIVDINGRLIKSIKVNKLVNSIDILDLARGSYWLQIDSQQPIQILKQ